MRGPRAEAEPSVTGPQLSPPVHAETIDAALDALRACGLRVSAARRVVLESLFATTEPISAEMIAEGNSEGIPRSDLASVYRNLEMLEDVGLVRHAHLGHGPGLYALAREGEPEFLVCEACGKVRSLSTSELARLRKVVHGVSGYRARFSHFPLAGLCPECQAESG
jgi:Fur family ferric uptake transcriptional regulator